MVKKIDLDKIKGYLGLAIKAKYVIFGSDNLKGYNHKLYLVLYRDDCGKFISKIIDGLKNKEINCVNLSVEEMTYLTGNNNCKLLGIKNKGLSDQINNILNSSIC